MTGFNCGSSAIPSGFSAVPDEQLDQIEGGITFTRLVVCPGAQFTKVMEGGGGGGVLQDLINFAASGGKVMPPA